MSDNEIKTSELSADELDQVAGGQSSSSNSLFEATSTGGAGVASGRRSGNVTRNKANEVEVGIALTKGNNPFGKP